MAGVRLSLAFTDSVRVRPLLDGEVQIEGVELIASRLPTAEIFWRQLHHRQFDISEMSLSATIAAIERGDSPWVAIPVFPARHFFHTWTLVNQDAGIREPRDLLGRTVGIPEYSMSAGVWSRGIFADEFGVEASDMRWVIGRSGSLSHGAATGVSVPDTVDATYCGQGDDLASMLAEGRIDALLVNAGRSAIDRNAVDLEQDVRVRPLFPDAVAEGTRYFRSTGVYPMNHTVVLNRGLVERHPWLPVNVFQAFARAKRAAWNRLLEAAEHYVDAGAIVVEPGDAIPYGVAANGRALAAFLRYAHASGVTERVLNVEELFDASTLELDNEAYGDPLPSSMR